MNVYVGRLARDLGRFGCGVDVYTRRTDSRAPQVVQLTSGARVVHVDAGPARPLAKSLLPLHMASMVTGIRSFVQAESLAYDVIHSHYWLSGMVALRLRTSLDAPVVHMFHTLARVKEKYAGAPDPTEIELRRVGERCVIGGVDAVVGATAAERTYMEQLYGRSPSRFAVIPPGVDTTLFQPHDRASSRRRLGVTGDPVVLFVGRPDRLKGLDTLLHTLSEIAVEMPGIKLLLVGGETSSDRGHGARTRKLVDQLGIAAHVEFRGVVPQDQLPLYYSAADLCAVPSSYESFGMVAVESMACETPVVAFPVGGLAATIRDGETGYLAAGRTGVDFTAALLRGLRARDRAHVGRQARASASRYSWDEVAQATMALYSTVLNDHSCWCPQLSGVG